MYLTIHTSFIIVLHIFLCTCIHIHYMFKCMLVVESYASLFLYYIWLFLITMHNHFNDSHLLICYEYYFCMKINVLKNLVFPNCLTGLCKRSRLNLFTVHVWEFYTEIAQKKKYWEICMHIIMYFQFTPAAEFSELQFLLSVNSNHQLKTSHIGMRLWQAYIRENWYI